MAHEDVITALGLYSRPRQREYLNWAVAANEFPASQKLVYVDVGGKIFRMLRQTVRNYPDSLFAKLLRECPDFGQQGQPVYIDRSPAAFEWILEIYR